MLVAAYVVCGFVALLVVSQCCVATAFLWRLLCFRRTCLSDEQLPKAAVVLSLRGPDPFLEGTLRGLLNLDYPDFSVHLIVDSETDPARAQLGKILEEVLADNVFVSILREPLTTCGLKCSALIQVVGELDPDIQVVAFLDADVAPHRSWLRDLVTPLSDPGIGVTFGNRWFVPRRANAGTLVRHVWNVGGVVQVWLNRLGWAGSMALRREVIDRTDMIEGWRHSLFDDSAVCRQLRPHGLRVHFVPGVLMANREEIPLRTFVGWMQRQLVAAKSSGPEWRLVALHALNLTVTQLAAIALYVWAIATGDTRIAQMSGIAILAYWGTAAMVTIAIEFAVRRILRENGETARWPL
ncbi:MAG TPA: glycosyltransferase family 2 protein, partial [Pirellulaceae bacterium]|nr:glycosyltransferase family 2 protein [Pirellulaceae bacterium]